MSEKHMSKDELVTMVRDIVGPQVAELMKASLAGALDPIKAQQSSIMAKLLADPAEREEKAKSTERFGRIVRAIGTAQLNLRRAGSGPTDVVGVLEKWGDKDLAGAMTKAMAAGSAADGGYLIPTQLSADIIEFLRPASIVRRLGPTVVPMPNGSLRVPKVTSGSSASYQTENADITQTQLAVGQVIMTFKKLTALVPTSNDLLRYAGPGSAGADGMIRDDVVRAIAQRESQAFLRDDGTLGTPRGIRNWAVAANIANSAGVTLANMTTDLGAMILALMNNNVPEGRWAWIMSPRNWNSLMTIQNANGFFVYRDEMSRGTLWGFPFGVTTQMLGSGATGEMYLVNMADAMIGEAQSLIIDISMEASYINAATNTLVSAFSLDQSVVRAIAEHDFAMRRGESVAVTQAMSW